MSHQQANITGTWLGIGTTRAEMGAHCPVVGRLGSADAVQATLRMGSQTTKALFLALSMVMIVVSHPLLYMKLPIQVGHELMPTTF